MFPMCEQHMIYLLQHVAASCLISMGFKNPIEVIRSFFYSPLTMFHMTVGQIDLMHDDVTRPERHYGSCSHAQIQDGRQ